MSEPTITLTGYFGKPKQVTRKEFARAWMDAVSDLYNLTMTADDHEYVNEVKAWVESKANEKFDRALDRERNDVPEETA